MLLGLLSMSDGSPDATVPPAEDDLTFREQQYSVTGVPGFTAFALKIVLTGTNSSYAPVVKDMRGIASGSLILWILQR